jgi:hypothetical protein
MARRVQPEVTPPPESASSWTFLTNHGHVLVCIAQNPEVRIAEIARLVGIGERAAHRLVNDLVVGQYVIRSKLGRRNTYEVRLDAPMRHPLEASHRLAEVFGPLST